RRTSPESRCRARSDSYWILRRWEGYRHANFARSRTGGAGGHAAPEATQPDRSADLVTGVAERILDRTDGQLAEVEHAGRQHGVGTCGDRVREVRRRARAAGGDHRHRDFGADPGDQVQIEAALGAVRVHRVQQDLAGAQFGAAPGPLHRVDAGGLAAAVSGGDVPVDVPSRVYREHQNLTAEPVGDLADHLGAFQRRGVDADLVGAGPQQHVDVVNGTHTAAHGQRDEHRLGGAPDHVQHRRAPVRGGGDVEERDLVRSRGLVVSGAFNRITGVTQILELDTLDDPAAGDVQARDDADRDRH